MAGSNQNVALRITAIYALVGVSWILFSDWLLYLAVGDPHLLTRLQMGKGWVYVAATAMLLYWLVHRDTAQISRSEEDLRVRNEELTVVEEELRQQNEELIVAEEELRQQLTENYESQKKLFEAHQAMAAILQASPVAIVALDREDKVVVWNRAAERLFGWLEGEVRGTPFSLLHPDDTKDEERVCGSACQEAVLHDIEGVRMKKNGELISVSISTAPLHDPAGLNAGVIAMFTDITDRKSAAKSLRKSNEKYVELVNAISGIVWELDVESFCFTFVSRRSEDILGYPAEAWLAEPGFWERCIHPDDRAWVLAACRTAHGEGTSHELEYRGLAADGHIIWLRNSFVVVEDTNGHVKLRGVMTDISRRKNAEDELSRLNAELEQRVAQRTSELAALNRELEAFSYTVSHDLRAPLRHIEGFGRALQEDYYEAFDDTGKLHLARLCSAARKMGQLIDDLLRLAMVSKGEINRRPTNLSTIAHGIVQDLTLSQPERAVAFRITDGIEVNGDPRLLQVVMENLLSNAWKYTGKRQDAVIEFGVGEDRGRTVFFVRDNGVGFANEHAEKIFKPFLRLHSAEDYEGSGVGLATVRRVVERHGGRVWAQGREGHGAVFFFTLDN
ncbi:PAS domain S-box protein [Geobacter sulfurreducens]|jgi:PAS domain S-box-containing protein|uniref:histidine kinase n=1 Tax=Geobacter sulfurreducens (strain ATCC 51573 / DSM 12127 / PCA) TaxID=243231 RepID=Q74GJ1_GEOSL|nr:PAS domain S-box protein [Geobacter sulfurreducens]AAR33589.1 sensor histidine kinase, PAS and PAS domain-containing [Geobacter sulfurreducens PCA]ADI83090.1 sensor histidine kinase, PAS and PAS domain-containing [Geobacter sulfurreducens KN400]UAC04348.1 PAS domain S-box protein [Geobacter sulfurreducens]HBB68361.1 PAS domain-containing sensor histidine kinase [Geobacter sulfurreducens]HCD97462.1 PAS domain-containing sensor histidine kinase [Geobacter sulfurreducens]